MTTPRYKAVVLYPPKRDIRLEEVEGIDIIDPDDAIVKINLCGLCGSDLHPYRGNEPFSAPFIMGHELVGEVVALGSSYGGQENSRPQLYSTLRVGDKVVSPFTVSCLECENCALGFSARCQHSQRLGSTSLPGAQAQYIRIPKAGGTLIVVNSDNFSGIPDSALLLMADILPTGYFAVRSALRHPNLEQIKKNGTFRVAVIGLGPVGLCALVSLLSSISEGRWETSASTCTVLAIDPNQSRRERAANIGALATLSRALAVNYLSPEEATAWTTQHGGLHAVCEMVGNNSALRLAYELIRPFGVISSIGVHTAPNLPFNGGELYDKNVSLSFGRCPVRSIFDEAFTVLKRTPEVFCVGEGKIIDKVVGFGAQDGSDVRRIYDEFDKGLCGKVIFDPWK